VSPPTVVAEKSLSGARALVTGGLGFIGSSLVRRLVKLGAQVTILDALIEGQGGHEFNVAGLNGDIRIDHRDIRDQQALTELIPGQDYLFNLAGQTSHMGSMKNPFMDLEVNAKSQLAIVETCRTLNPGVKIVFTSTRQIYGRPDYLPVDEKHPLRPVDVNGVNKLAGEGFHRLYNEVYGIRSCVLRLTNTYGPRMRVKDAAQTFVGIWIRRILEGQDFEVWGGGQLRDFTYVEDLVDALILCAERSEADGRTFNLGGEMLSLRDLADALVRVHGAGTFVVKEYPAARAAIEIGDYRGDYSAIKNAVGWQPRTGIDEGLTLTLRYFEDTLSRYI
jgi:UDP-glucose 4-epimerase